MPQTPGRPDNQLQVVRTRTSRQHGINEQQTKTRKKPPHQVLALHRQQKGQHPLHGPRVDEHQARQRYSSLTQPTGKKSEPPTTTSA